MKLYWGSGSPVSWRAQLALAIKGIAYESHRLDLGAKEFRSPDFLTLNPRGTFPVLVHGDIVVRDSIAICSYLDRAFPEPALLGSTPAEHAAIWQFVGDHGDFLGKATQTITRQFFRKAGVTDPEALGDAIELAGGEVGALAETLSAQDFIVGDAISLADIVAYPTMHRLLRAASKPEAKTYPVPCVAPLAPSVAAWMERVRSLPGVEDSYPPHWR